MRLYDYAVGYNSVRDSLETCYWLIATLARRRLVELREKTILQMHYHHKQKIQCCHLKNAM